LTQDLLLFAVAGINYVTGLENGYLLAGAGTFALVCGGAVLLFAFWQARRSRDAFRKSLAYFRAVARSDDRSIHNMGDFFSAAAAIGGTFIAVLVAGTGGKITNSLPDAHRCTRTAKTNKTHSRRIRVAVERRLSTSMTAANVTDQQSRDAFDRMHLTLDEFQNPQE
jgi:hypothetical protein